MKWLTVLWFLPLSCLASMTLNDSKLFNHLEKKFILYQEKHAKCSAIANNSKISESVLEIINGLDIDNSVVIGYPYKMSLELCSSKERTDVMRLILMIDQGEKTDLPLSSKFADSIKNIMYTGSDLYLESKLLSLSDNDQRMILELSEELKPFNLVDAYERINLIKQ
ncbi:hypothetical protein [Vibrio sp. SCSIO 43136]|uniref:hypothetical protein n=1 Tax=Vibrio sp. SCSIO 43136 TaxID=2819101 RepID=UPI002075728E|nr:hypothetical protein [Vibrio sp. SCSIO 43136]USD66471.1 hypothetical protein J4N39_06590 [Vibrio sp. SCSIO 43136]